MVRLPTQPRRSFIDSQAYVANIAAKEVGSVQAFYGDVLGRNCVGVLVECSAFFERVALIETGLQGSRDGKTEEAYV